jgi:hypothetical protein
MRSSDYVTHDLTHVTLFHSDKSATVAIWEHASQPNQKIEMMAAGASPLMM